MDAHENARTTLHSRMLIVERLAAGWTVDVVATALGTSSRTGRKWRDRFAAEGEPGLRDRSSRPHHSPARLATTTGAAIEGLRRQRLRLQAVTTLELVTEQDTTTGHQSRPGSLQHAP